MNVLAFLVGATFGAANLPPGAMTLKEAMRWEHDGPAFWVGDLKIKKGEKGFLSQSWEHRITVGVRNKTLGDRHVQVFVVLLDSSGALLAAASLTNEEITSISKLEGRTSKTFYDRTIIPVADFGRIRYVMIRPVTAKGGAMSGTPQPVDRKSGEVSEKSGPLTYKIVSMQDLSYGDYQGAKVAFKGKRRKGYRVMLECDGIPSEEALKDVARKIWMKGNREWDEFTVWIYLPDQEPGAELAYAIGEFTPDGLKELKLNKESYDMQRKIDKLRERQRGRQPSHEALDKPITLKPPYDPPYPGAGTDRLSSQYALPRILGQVGMTFCWDESVKDRKGKARTWTYPNFDAVPLGVALERLLKPLGLSYEVKGLVVVLKAK